MLYVSDICTVKELRKGGREGIVRVCATVNEAVREDTAERETLKWRAEEGEELCHTCAWGISASVRNVLF